MPDAIRDGRLPLEPGGYVYVIAGKDALPVLEQFMFNNINDKQLQQMIDRTRFAAAAVYVSPNSHYRLAAWGNYPASRAKMALGASKEWKKQRSPASAANYWHSPQRGYSVAITAGIALVAAAVNEKPPYTIIDPYSAAPGIALPEGFAAFREGSIFSCWLTDPAPAINQKIKEMGIPIEIPARQIFVSLVPEDGERAADDQRYIARLQVHFDSASQAKALTVLLAFARNFIPPPLSILFANSPAQDENNLNFTTAPITVREIALLLKLFSL